MPRHHATQPGSHPHADRGADLYETPAVAVEALLRAESLPHRIWEPAAGRGAIVRVLRNNGHAVIASDLIDYGFPLHFAGDFLSQTAAPIGCECIITNPPFKIADRFIAHALDLAPLVIMLARLALSSASRWWRPASIISTRRSRRNQRKAHSQNSPAGCATTAVRSPTGSGVVHR